MDAPSTENDRITTEPVKGPLADLLRKHNCVHAQDYIKVNPSGTIMPIHYEDYYKMYEEFVVKEDDVYVVSYPKAGTTWTQEIVWCIMFDMNSPEAEFELMRRFPFLEFDALINPEFQTPDKPPLESPTRRGNSWKLANTLKSPRTIKSHLPEILLPPQIWTVKPKIIYVTRDPRDVCVSYYYHNIKLEGYTGSFDEFVKIFVGDMATYSPIWPHMIDFWEKRNDDHILFIRYEELKEDMAAMVKRIAEFLEKPVSEQKVNEIVEHCTFDTMKNNSAANNEFIVPDPEAKIKFMRKGIVGDWKNHLSSEHVKAFKEWTMRNVKGTDFPYYQDYD